MTTQEIIGKVRKGSTLTADLRHGRFVLDGKTHDASEIVQTREDAANPVTRLEELYAIYKHSVPSERSDRRRTKNFKAIPEHRLSQNDILFGTPREEALAELELHLLASVASGAITWESLGGGAWFWQSGTDPDLILLRSWVEYAK